MENLNRSASLGPDKAPLPLGPAAFMHNFQHTGLQVLRAQERMMHGMVNAAKLEMKFAQELMTNRLALMKWDAASQQPSPQYATGEFERAIGMIREVAAELHNGFSEATQLLAEGKEPPLREAVRDAAQTSTQTGDTLSKTRKLSPDHGGEDKAGEPKIRAA